MCSEIDAYPVNMRGFAAGKLSEAQVVEAQGMLTLCPDQPQAAIVQVNIDAGPVLPSFQKMPRLRPSPTENMLKKVNT